MDIVVEVYEDSPREWWWRAERVKLQRGPFTDQAAADSDAESNAELLISALCARELRR
jgi:hypothetical protein